MPMIVVGSMAGPRANSCRNKYGHIYPYMTVWTREIERLGQATGTFLQNGVAPMEGWQAACACRAACHGHGNSPRRASERATRCGLVRQSFLRGAESGLG